MLTILLGQRITTRVGEEEEEEGEETGSFKTAEESGFVSLLYNVDCFSLVYIVCYVCFRGSLSLSLLSGPVNFLMYCRYLGTIKL